MNYNYKEIFEIYSKLKNLLIEKNEVIINKNIERLAQIDEETLVISEQLNSSNLKEILSKLNEEQKKELKNLAKEIQTLKENNEMLIKHSIDVINGLFSGILNITQKNSCSYNSKGENCTSQETYQISSITEEA